MLLLPTGPVSSPIVRIAELFLHGMGRPIRPGRNLAIIVESAAVNYRQKKMGYNAAQELYNRVQANLGNK